MHSINEETTIEELASEMTDMEIAFANHLVNFPGKTDKQCLRDAGSQANDKNLSKIAYQIKKKPYVEAYIDRLRKARAKDTAISLEEIVANARRAIEMAFVNKKPKDAEPHNRLLAELGGHVKSGNQSGPTTVNVGTKVEYRRDELDSRIEEFISYSGPKSEDIPEGDQET